MKLLNISKKIDQKIEEMNYQPSKTKIRSKYFWKGMSTGIVIIILLFGISGWQVYAGVKNLKKYGTLLNESYKEQNFDQIKINSAAVKSSLVQIDRPLMLFVWVKWIPFIGGYFGDAKSFIDAGIVQFEAVDMILTKIEPDKGELGFNGTPMAGPERAAQIVKILQKVIPDLDKIQPKLDQAASQVENINIDKYPEEIRGIRVRKLVETGRDFIVGASIAIKDHKDALITAPAALGMESPKSYLLLFQNDKEIRATGGFLTAFAILKLDKGQISTTASDDIYHLDEELLKICLHKICPLTPPAPIAKYLPEFDGKPRKAWSMRDSNLSPDIPKSAKQFETMYEFLGQGLPFDGIIYIDTQVVEQIIEVTGPIEVFGTKYSADNDPRCNCPNVIYELENYAEKAAKNDSDRKAVLGVLMQQIMSRALGADVSKLPQLIQTVIKLANQKHVMMYVHDDSVQKSLSGLNWTGEIKSYDGDYLHINDSNFAGGKSNLYVNQIVTQEITIGKNDVTHKKLTIEYKNPQQFNLWLNGINRDYVRIYVPKGSKLISSKGSNQQVTTSEELDKTVFDAFITVNPQNYRVLSFEYEIPYNPSGEYKLLIQKQPGAKDFLYKTNINGRPQPEFYLVSDQEMKLGV